MSFLTKEITLSMKAANVLLIIGLAMFAAGVGIIVYNMSAAKGEENSLTFERTVTARITDCRVTEHTRSHKKSGGTGYYTTVVSRDYTVDFLVTTDGGTYEDSQDVPKDIYDSYSAMERNRDMEWKLYRNPDGSAFLSQQELPAAQEEYRGTGYVTHDMGIRMIIGMVTAFIGWGFMAGGANSRRKARRRAEGA